MKYLQRGILVLMSISLALLAGCNTKEENASLLSLLPVIAASQCPEMDLPAGATLLKSGSVYISPQWYCYYLLRLEFAGMEAAYAMWIPPPGGGVRPAVVLTRPYDYISWSGDDVPRGSETRVQQYVADAVIFMLNNIGVLNVFERYYAGGSIQNDVDDTVAGLRFLNEAVGLVDKTRIGIWGGSWGGFEALYGAAYSSDGGGAVPCAGVAFFPLSDFNDEVEYVENPAGGVPNSIPDITDTAKKDQFEEFFSPYLDRIKATAAWADWDGDALLAKLATPFVVVHDEWDTLVPFEQSVYLAVNAPPGAPITPIFFYQDTARDLDALYYGWGHGELREYRLDAVPPPADGIVYGVSSTLAYSFLFARLASADQLIFNGYDEIALRDFVEYARDIKCADPSRDDMSWARELLHESTDERIIMINMADFSTASGAEVVAGAFSAAGWGGPDYGTASSVRSSLAGGLPACP
ncbi:MAG TPA: prolyl oligopeptidase family serine peptidase [Spirochaetota bacterium]|nr:prolyl oligopeptidase family serine peptidase [Spirochaetota bacterium]HOD14504.1 prolyl oligopeptidase family serine peptidase [Spirochaetota bacterium]HPG52287.1 prolyl oligopeptidase family serine peptidase [Spirochaetota bacterium]HPN12785.1 prolyl oligopeptidase family serine peptidase [Spirochaetota bacterium]HQL81599.1 prolyl oligopeptidase family serine peptidase [Spirochaetota bacterium]